MGDLLLNSKIFFLSALLLAGCGVKARPLSPPETAIQSYTQSYTGPTEPEKEKEKKLETPTQEIKK